MTKIFISKETKKFQQEINDATGAFSNFSFVICENWQEFADNYNKGVSYIALPHKTGNGMWGVVYYRKGGGDYSDSILHFSASQDIHKERMEVSDNCQLHVRREIHPDPDSYFKSPKVVNTNNSVEFSIDYTNFILDRLISLEYGQLFAMPKIDDERNVSYWWEPWQSFSESDIVKHCQSEEYQNFKDKNDLAELRKEVPELRKEIEDLKKDQNKNRYDLAKLENDVEELKKLLLAFPNSNLPQPSLPPQNQNNQNQGPGTWVPGTVLQDAQQNQQVAPPKGNNNN